MKFTVTMKDPDTLQDAIREAVGDEVKTLGLSVDEADAVAELRYDAVVDVCDAWFGYGEYLSVEIDTEAKTCIVQPDQH